MSAEPHVHQWRRDIEVRHLTMYPAPPWCEGCGTAMTADYANSLQAIAQAARAVADSFPHHGFNSNGAEVETAKIVDLLGALHALDALDAVATGKGEGA